MEVLLYPGRIVIDQVDQFLFKHIMPCEKLPDDHASYLPVRTIEGCLPGVVCAPPVGIGHVLLEHGTVIHECIVPLPRIVFIEGFFYKGEDLPITNILPILEEEVDEHPPDI